MQKKITAKIKSFEDACAHLAKDPANEIPFPNPVTPGQEATNAFHQLDIINEALLDGVKLDWTNSNQKKWYCWFNNYSSGSGFRFRGTLFDWSLTYSRGGARLCLDTEEKAKYFGKQFIKIWNKYLNPIK